MSQMFRALRIRNYRLYTIGSVVSNTGTWMQRVAQDWLVLQLFAGDKAAAATALAITTSLQFLPSLLFSAYAGVIADRMPKRRMLQMTQAWMGISSLILGVIAVTGVLELWMVFVLVGLFGIGAAFDGPARQAFVSEMVGPDDLTNAVGLNSAGFNLAQLVGPAISGFMIAALGGGVGASGTVILINGVSYIAVIYALVVMDTDKLFYATASDSGSGTVRAGLRYIRSRSDLMLILSAVFFIGMFGLNFQMTSALIATHEFNKGASEYGLLGTTLAIGSLLGALTAARRVARPRLRLVVIAGLGVGVADILLGLMPTYIIFAIATPMLGFATITMLNAANTALQLNSDPMMRGRVMAVYMMCIFGGMAMGAQVLGWLGANFGARWTFLGGGIGVIVGITIAALLFRDGEGNRPVLWQRDRPTPLHKDTIFA